ncbi:MAG TPA: aminotransferase class IV, partial [Gemmatimonadaceae bacterium]|nr:aminotransferase class IV [Gemmatimonadaceae bacterium]
MAEVTSGRTTKIWRDGQFVAWEDATIHVMSHAIHYASSVFEGIRCYETAAGPAVFRAADHMRRLQDSCRIYRMPLKHDLDTLVQAAMDTVTANDVRHCYLRPIVVRTGSRWASTRRTCR